MDAAFNSYPPYSYLITPPASKDVIGRQKVPFQDGLHLPCGRHFFHSPDLDVSISRCEESGAYVLVAGLLIAIVEESLDNASISLKLLGTLKKNKEEFLRSTDLIGGRYIMVFRENDNESPVVVGDATNMLKINYSAIDRVCSSNIFIIDDFVSGGLRDYRKEFVSDRDLWNRGSLGNCSPLNGIKILTPNHYLVLDSFAIERFYPRAVLVENNDLDSVVSDVKSLFAKQDEILLSHYTLVHSLTAGQDSRVSLSISPDRNNEKYFFTYYLKGKNKNVTDVAISKLMSERLGLRHFLIVNKDVKQPPGMISENDVVIDYRVDADLLSDMGKWCWYDHIPGLVSVYRNYIGALSADGKPVINVRSNLYEIGRVIWGRKGPCYKVNDVLKYSRPDWERRAKLIFESYFHETKLDSDSVYNFNLLDLFYWEHRCATWGGEILQETDFAFNTVSYFNCRRIIELSLSLPFAIRKEGLLFKSIVDSNCPEISDIPVNPVRLPFRGYLGKLLRKLGLVRE